MVSAYITSFFFQVANMFLFSSSHCHIVTLFNVSHNYYYHLFSFFINFYNMLCFSFTYFVNFDFGLQRLPKPHLTINHLSSVRGLRRKYIHSQLPCHLSATKHASVTDIINHYSTIEIYPST